MISTSIEFDLLSKTSTDTLSLYLCNLEIDCVTLGEGGRKGRREIEEERRTVSNTNILLRSRLRSKGETLFLIFGHL